jgi:hypothetical protein
MSNRQDNETYQKRIWIAPSVMLGIGLAICVCSLFRFDDIRVIRALVVSTISGILGALAGYTTAAVLLTGWPYSIPHSLYRITAVLLLLASFQLLTVGDMFSPMVWIIAIVALYFLIINFLDTDAKDAGLVSMCMVAGNFLGISAGMRAVYLILK